jgi:hypothetical protein
MTTRALWLACRRPLLVGFVFGCAVSLMTAGRLTIRLAAPATIYWSFVPLVEIAGMAAVWRGKSPAVSWAHAIDLFFRGHLPWCLWVTGFAAEWAFLPPALVYHVGRWPWPWYGLALATAVWSGYLDYRFFRVSWDRPVRALLVQRAISWTLGIAWFMAPSVWSVAAPRLGLV